MNLINELGTDLALAFLVERRYLQKIDSEDALALISRVQGLLESASSEAAPCENTKLPESPRISSAH